MSLITYSNIEDGTIADANMFNSRYGQIIGVLNGNIDSSNISNGAITNAKIANGAVTASKINTSNTIDDNGWTVSDFGGIKTYSYAVTANGSYSDFNGTVGVRVPSQDRVTIASINPPVGVPIANLRINITYVGAYSGLIIAGIESSSSQFIIQAGNNYSSGTALSCNGKFYITATQSV